MGNKNEFQNTMALVGQPTHLCYPQAIKTSDGKSFLLPYYSMTVSQRLWTFQRAKKLHNGNLTKRQFVDMRSVPVLDGQSRFIGVAELFYPCNVNRRLFFHKTTRQ